MIVHVGEAAKSFARSPLHQLPPPPADFKGRQEHKKALLEAARAGGGAAICGLQGEGGIGKTALALVVAHELAADYPDAQLFLDLQGVSPRPLTPAEVMAHAIRSFLPEDPLPAEPQLPAHYRDLLAGKRALLVLDNAADRSQVEPLLPPPGNALLVTSRRRFTLPGLAVRDLEALEPAASRELLLAIEPRIGHIGDAADELARLCCHLPFALRLAAGTLHERKDWTVESYRKRLAQDDEKAGIAETVLGVSYELLTGELREHYRRLAVFAGDFDAPAAAAVWGLAAEAADHYLGALVRGSLLDGQEGRYRLHDLARAFASRKLTEQERDEAATRHAEHYLAVLFAADQLYLEGGKQIIAGLRLFDRERHQILAGQTWAARNLERSEAAAHLSTHYPNSGAYVLFLRLSPWERIEWLEVGLAGAGRLADRAAAGTHLGNVGSAYFMLGDARKAIEYHQQHLDFAREIGDRRGEGNALNNLGLAYANLGKTQKAIEHYEQRLVIAREIGDRRGEGNALGNLGLAYANLGEPRKAIQHYEQQLVIAREIGDRRGEGNALGNLGLAYADLGEPGKAIQHYEQQLVITREIGDRRGEGNAFGNLGNAYADLGETQRAIDCYKQRLAIAREIGDRRGEAIASWNWGLRLQELGDLTGAVEKMQVLVDFEREIGHVDAEKDAADVEEIRARLAAGP